MKKETLVLTTLLAIFCLFIFNLSHADTKWVQPPNMGPGLCAPCHFGGDWQSNHLAGPNVVDDFLCSDPDPIIGICWWGSYMDGLPVQPGIKWFKISFHFFDPTGLCLPAPFPMWMPFPATENYYGTTPEGEDIYYYCIYSIDFDPFPQWEGEPTVWWIDIAYDDTMNQEQRMWGWHESSTQWGCPAVQSYPPYNQGDPQEGPWYSLDMFGTEPPIDMAFELYIAEQPTMYPVFTECPQVYTECPATPTECFEAQTECPEIATECPVLSTSCPVDPTNCPVIATQCVEQPVETVCPELTTWCPDDDPTICFITECPEEPTWCPIEPTSCPDIPTIQPEIITECPLVDTICTQTDTVCGTEFTFCPELITECFWSPTYCSFEYTFCEINWFTLCPEIPTVCPDSTPTVCKVTLCPEDQTLCSPVDTACPLEPTFCDPAGPTFCNQITFCQIPITECPLPCEPTIFPNEPTECPMRWTFCPEQITQCPVIKTACPFDDPTICSIDLLPTECPTGDFTWCPEIPTQCPQLDTWCPDNLPTLCEVTACPDDLTWCPIDPTVCPSVDIPTICPVVDTACPVIDTACPAVITACLVDPTICEITECPVDPTTCPHIPTECDLGEFTMCPGDNDGDGVSNCNDNCYKHPNGPLGGTCTSGNYGTSCTVPGGNITECGIGGYCSMMQEDTYPPGGNGAGCADACECEGNFNADEDDDVDGSDAALFKADFGRGGYNRPCSTSDPCDGDFDCDTDVDGSDASLFKSDFGRGGYNNPCPICLTDPWCVYP